MKLVADWKDVWKWYSTHALVLSAALAIALAGLPAHILVAVPMWAQASLHIFIAVSGVLGRVLDQPAKK